MSKKFLSCAALVALLLCQASNVFAAAWTLPNNIRYVQLDTIPNNGRTYDTIQAALDNITDADWDNPYVIKIMPGIYDQGTASLQMKPYVDLEGSGNESTVIVTSNVNVDGDTCEVGTIIMATNSSIRHLKVVNLPAAQNGSYKAAVGVVFYDGVNAKIEDVHILVGSDSVDSGRPAGVCSYGEGTYATLDNVTIEAHSNGGQSNGILAPGGSVNVTNSKLSVFNTTGNGHGINAFSSIDSIYGYITVSDTTFECTSDWACNSVYADAIATSIMTSRINLYVGVNGVAANGLDARSGTVTMVGTTITSNVTATYENGIGSNLKIATSLLPGDLSGLTSTGAKLVHNFDASFSPITNQ